MMGNYFASSAEGQTQIDTDIRKFNKTFIHGTESTAYNLSTSGFVQWASSEADKLLVDLVCFGLRCDLEEKVGNKRRML
jgi:hypothetical protein